MDYSQAAIFLGVSQRSLQRYVQEGRVPYVRLPQRGAWAGIRFVRSDLLRWLEQRTVKPRRDRVRSAAPGTL
ncbi:MAG: helix-turn-helix domain-containing protein [Acidobacteriia bacterium]|nr:helix-turn-helix domain-containing protein [Terriglobia bacterium]